MIVIEKKDIKYYRYAALKYVFLKLFNNHFELVRDIPRSRAFVLKKKKRILLRREDIEKPKLVENFINTVVKLHPEKEYEFHIYERKTTNKSSENNKENKIVYVELNLSNSENIEKYFDLEFDFYNEELIKPIEAFTKPLTFHKYMEAEYKCLFEYLFLKDYKKDKKFFKYRKDIDISLPNPDPYNFTKGCLSFTNPSKFNDPFDCNSFYSIESDFNPKANLRKYFKVLSVTENNKNILMWSHYGDFHQGVCYQYSYSDLIKKLNDDKLPGLCIVGEVDYDDTIVKKKMYGSLSYTALEDIVNLTFKKFKKWEYEEETRFVWIQPEEDYYNRSILPKDGCCESNDDFYTFNLKIEKIYVGCQNYNTYDYFMKYYNMFPVKLIQDDNDYKLLEKKEDVW